MNISFIDFILCFSVYSSLGWILEKPFKTMRDRQFVAHVFLCSISAVKAGLL